MTTRTSFSRTPTRRAPRALAAGLLGLAATLSLTACQWTSPITTQLQYDPADGKSTQVGKVKVLNALIIADTQGGPGTLLASFANEGTDKTTIKVTVGQQAVGSVEVPAGQTVQASTDSKRMQIAKVPVPPGAMTEVMFRTGDGSTTPIDVVVLPPNPPYASLAPTGQGSSSGAATAGSTTGTPTGGATAAPSTSTTP